MVEGGALALRAIRAGTRLTVYRALPYWCVGKTRPRGIVFFCKFGLFGGVFLWQKHQDMKMCHIRNELCPPKLRFLCFPEFEHTDIQVRIWGQSFGRHFCNIFWKNRKFRFLKGECLKQIWGRIALRVGSGGNQVDVLPPVRNIILVRE